MSHTSNFTGLHAFSSYYYYHAYTSVLNFPCIATTPNALCGQFAKLSVARSIKLFSFTPRQEHQHVITSIDIKLYCQGLSIKHFVDWVHLGSWVDWVSE